ncbi:MAG: cytochrome c [Bacteroidota bacterium]
MSFLLISCNSKEKRKSYADASEIRNVAQDDKLKESMARGEEIYNDFCINCHMPNGKGVGRTYPPLANSDYLKENQEESIRGVKYGQQGRIVVNGKVYNNAMMSMGLEDEEVADVMNYINNSWGNDYGTLITAEQVSEIKK